MATSYLTPNMNLVVPIVGQEPGPNWANDLNASLTILDNHNHAPGNGIQITPSGININADLPFNNTFNAITLRSVRFFPNITPISLPSDLGCLYESGVDLYFNDGNGNQIRITQSGTVAGSTGTITGLPSGTASASYQSISGTFQFQQATNTAANIDVASVILRNSTPSSNGLTLSPPTLSSNYGITLPLLPSSPSAFLSMSNAGVQSAVIVSDESTTTVSGNILAVKTAGITNVQIAPSTILGTNIGGSTIPFTKFIPRTIFVNTPASIGGIALGGSSGSFSTGSTSPVPVSNCTCTLTTNGGPIFLIAMPASASASQIASSGTGGSVTWSEQFAGTLATFFAVGGPPGGYFTFVGFPAGTYTFTLNAQANGGGTVFVTNVQIIAYEF